MSGHPVDITILAGNRQGQTSVEATPVRTDPIDQSWLACLVTGSYDVVSLRRQRGDVVDCEDWALLRALFSKGAPAVVGPENVIPPRPHGALKTAMDLCIEDRPTAVRSTWGSLAGAAGRSAGDTQT